MSDISSRGGGGNESAHWPSARAIALGEFLGSAHWVVTPTDRTTPEAKIAPDSPARDWKENFAGSPEFYGAQDAASDTELGPLLATIADDVNAMAEGARQGVLADFAARIDHARKYLPRHAVAGAVAMLKEACKAALAVVKRSAALELAGRKKAAIAARQRARGNGNGWRPSL